MGLTTEGECVCARARAYTQGAWPCFANWQWKPRTLLLDFWKCSELRGAGSHPPRFSTKFQEPRWGVGICIREGKPMVCLCSHRRKQRYNRLKRRVQLAQMQK